PHAAVLHRPVDVVEVVGAGDARRVAATTAGEDLPPALRRVQELLRGGAVGVVQDVPDAGQSRAAGEVDRSTLRVVGQRAVPGHARPGAERGGDLHARDERADDVGHRLPAHARAALGAGEALAGAEAADKVLRLADEGLDDLLRQCAGDLAELAASDVAQEVADRAGDDLLNEPGGAGQEGGPDVLDLLPGVAEHAAVLERLTLAGHRVQAGDAGRAADRARELRAHDRLAARERQAPARGGREVVDVATRRVAGQDTAGCVLQRGDRRELQVQADRIGDLVPSLLDALGVDRLNDEVHRLGSGGLDLVPGRLDDVLDLLEGVADRGHAALQRREDLVTDPAPGSAGGGLDAVPRGDDVAPPEVAEEAADRADPVLHRGEDAGLDPAPRSPDRRLDAVPRRDDVARPEVPEHQP